MEGERGGGGGGRERESSYIARTYFIHVFRSLFTHNNGRIYMYTDIVLRQFCTLCYLDDLKSMYVYTHTHIHKPSILIKSKSSR